FSTHDYNFLQDHWKLQQTQQHQQPHQLYQRQQQQQQQQHLHKLYQQQRQYQQQLQYQHQQQHLQQQLQQRAIFLTPSPSHQQVFIYGQHLMIGTYLSNITFQQWPSNFYQRFPTPFLLPTHYHLDLKNNDSLTATKTQQ
ncbi:PREDICTED: protein URE2-like, partial [Diuraphis noxia]|uniref:protein URE2-like n=1 Tax=Diuraphis noxia TaxID=143948 RepID=UPI000763853C